MNSEAIITGVQAQAEWWLDERFKKVKQEKHATMEVNPFMAPLVSALHGHSDFLELADFLLGGHFAIGHATGFGKLIDEKVLPRVFGTTKLDKATRPAGSLFAQACFDNIDHVVRKNGEEILLSLKASKWTIQLGQAIQLNNSFKLIRDSFEAAEHAHKRVVIATFYGTAEKLTDKYDLVRGINTGANHDVHDLQEYVTILSGHEFWAWLGDHEDTQLWVLQGIQSAIAAKREELREAQNLMAEFRNSFARRFAAFIDADGIIDWVGILKATNGG